jgi:FKBP-type peptidyl-prolyl cis-trans isomerase FkpA
MKFDRLVLLLLFLGCVLPACATESSPATVQSSDLATDELKTLYALGMVMGQNMEGAGLTEEELATVLVGFSDTAMGREAQVDLEQYGPMLSAFMQARIEAAAAGELVEATAFVEAQAALDGAIVTDSGIVIQELVAGTGASPTPTDTVEVHYHGTLRNGTVFDSSVDRGTPATFPLNGVIPCWTEGVQTLKVGGKSVLVCPPGSGIWRRRATGYSGQCRAEV